jgi:hypothetical protein
VYVGLSSFHHGECKDGEILTTDEANYTWKNLRAGAHQNGREKLG